VIKEAWKFYQANLKQALIPDHEIFCSVETVPLHNCFSGKISCFKPEEYQNKYYEKNC